MNSKKNAILINGFLIGGAERLVETLIRNISTESPIEIISLQRNTDILPDASIRPHFLSKSKGKESSVVKLLMLPVLARRLIKIIKQEKIGRVQAHLFRAAYVNLIAKKLLKNFKAEIFIHGDPNQYKKKHILGAINLFLIKWLFPTADRIITNTEGMAGTLKTIIGQGIKIDVFPNLFDQNYITELSQSKFNEAEFIPTKEKRYLITVGRLYASKRQADIIRALKIVLKDIPDCELLIIGDGKKRTELQRLAKELDLNLQIHFLGSVNNPFKYIRSAELMISASESESFGNVLVESMLCGVPVIAADCDFGPREILTRKGANFKMAEDVFYGDYGVLFRIGDYKALAKIIITLLSDKKMWQTYVNKSFERGKFYSVEHRRDLISRLFHNENPKDLAC